MPRKMKDSGVEWLGQVPEGWSLRCLFQQVRQVKNKNENLREKNLLSLSYGKIKRKSIDAVGGLLPASFEGYNRIEPGDIVLRLTDLQNDQHSLRTGLSKERGIVTSAYVTVRPSIETSSDFLHFVLYAFDVAKGFYGMGSGVRQGLTYDDIKLLKLPHPPLPEQRAIAAYLDERCAKIDTMIAEAKETIEEYKQWKQSLIFEAVTGKREVESGKLRVESELRDPGVEWLGQVPEGWMVTPLKYLVSDYKVGPFGSALITSNLLSQGQILVYTPEHIAKKTSELNDNLFLPDERKEEMSQFFVHEGDVIFPIVGSLGRAMLLGKTDPSGIINQRLAKFRLNSKVDASYFMWLYGKSDFYKQHIEVSCRGTIIVNLTKTIVGEMPVPLPNHAEQRAIAAYLDRKCAAIDRVVVEKEGLIADLEQYKKSLIFECVTGKREAV